MGRPIGPKKVHRYSAEFKLTAVKLTKMPGVEVQTVAEALDIHPFMLSRWRTEAREGVLRGKAKRIEAEPRRAREIKRLQALERAHAILKAEHELFKKSHPVLFRTKAEIFEFIDHQRGTVDIRRACALYGVTRAGYYAWRHRGESARRRQDQGLLVQIHALFDRSRGTYGSPRIHRARLLASAFQSAVGGSPGSCAKPDCAPAP